MAWTQEQYEAHLRRTSPNQKQPQATSRNETLEREIHEEIEQHCRRQGWMVVHSRMDRPTTQAAGVPDFIVALPDGRTVWAEVKRPGGKPTEDQLGAIAWLRKLGHRGGIVHSLEEFKTLCS